MKIKIHLKPIEPIMDSITLSQKELSLSDEEIKDMEEVLKYVQLYYTPEGYKATGLDYISE